MINGSNKVGKRRQIIQFNHLVKCMHKLPCRSQALFASCGWGIPTVIRLCFDVIGKFLIGNYSTHANDADKLWCLVNKIINFPGSFPPLHSIQTRTIKTQLKINSPGQTKCEKQFCWPTSVCLCFCLTLSAPKLKRSVKILFFAFVTWFFFILRSEQREVELKSRFYARKKQTKWSPSKTSAAGPNFLIRKWLWDVICKRMHSSWLKNAARSESMA